MNAFLLMNDTQEIALLYICDTTLTYISQVCNKSSCSSSSDNNAKEEKLKIGAIFFTVEATRELGALLNGGCT